METAQSRYFVALLPPEPIQSEVRTLQQGFYAQYGSRAALRSPPHITLQPPFMWPSVSVEQLHRSLAAFAAETAPLPIELLGFGAFRPRVIYIDVVKTAELMALQPALMDHVAQDLGIVDVRSQQRRFAPHLTIAFRDLKPATFHRAWSEFEHRPYQKQFMADSLTLLQHDGQRWQVSRLFYFKS